MWQHFSGHPNRGRCGLLTKTDCSVAVGTIDDGFGDVTCGAVREAYGFLRAERVLT